MLVEVVEQRVARPFGLRGCGLVQRECLKPAQPGASGGAQAEAAFLDACPSTRSPAVLRGQRPGVASLRAHAAYLNGLGDGSFDAEEFLEGLNRPTGTRLGVRYGAAFEVFRFDLW